MINIVVNSIRGNRMFVWYNDPVLRKVLSRAQERVKRSIGQWVKRIIGVGLLPFNDN